MKLRKLALSASILGITTYLYQRSTIHKNRQIHWVRRKSHLLETPRGIIEYAVHGAGKPILYVHGGMGGYEQGLALADILNFDDVQWITFSRPGYRRTNLGVARTLDEQADMIRELLDYLNLEKVTVVGLSGGGLASLQFAQNYPERCNGLIMLSAHSPELARKRPSRFWLWLFDAMLASNFLVWLMMGIGFRILNYLLRVRNLTDNLANIENFFAGVYPSSDWVAGSKNDIDQLLGQTSLDLTKIRVPTLVIHGEEDNIVPPEVGRDTARKIPQAKLEMIDDGSHMMMATHSNKLRDLIKNFTS